ncbi:MAG: hypothetical protein HPY67_05020 [Syntrophaceae bacterium]|nr:hypothetical protein [Syntrophaceae bacterium]
MMLISTGDSGAAVNGPVSILAESAGASLAKRRFLPAGYYDYYSTNMPEKPAKGIRHKACNNQ